MPATENQAPKRPQALSAASAAVGTSQEARSSLRRWVCPSSKLALGTSGPASESVQAALLVNGIEIDMRRQWPAIGSIFFEQDVKA